MSNNTAKKFNFPLAYYLANMFLDQYKYHTELNILIFVYTAMGILILALLTVGVQSAKVALRNPVNALRIE